MNNLGRRASSDFGPPQGQSETKEAAASPKPRDLSGLRYKILLILIAILWLVVIAVSWVGAEDSAHADDAAPATASSSSASSDDEYNFNWLDPEKKIYVLQNRRYLKAHRALLSLMIGPGLSNPYRNTFNVDPRVAYYFNEQWGIEGFYTVSFNTPNEAVQALADATPTTLSVAHEVRGEGGALVHWVPWYAKLNFFNKILYFDWYLEGGGGEVNWSAFGTGTSTAAAQVIGSLGRPAAFAGTGMQFHLNENLAVRLDFMGAYFTAPIEGVTGDTSWFSNYNFGIGLGVRL